MKDKQREQESRLSQRPVTRREFLQWSAAGAGGLLLAGRDALAAPAPAPKLENELVFACNGGGTQKAFEEHFFPEFSKRYGVAKFTYVAGQPAPNMAKLRAQKASPAIDVIWLAGSHVYQAIDENLVIELDPKVMTNYQYTEKSLATEKSAAAIGITVCGLLYNTEVYKKLGFTPPTSWWDMWDAKVKGHVGCYSMPITAANAWLTKISMMLTGQYKNVDPVFAKLRELRPNMLGFYNTAGAYDTATQQGDLWLQMNTSVRAQQMVEAGLPIGFVQPKEGLVGYETWAGVVKGAPHPNVAQAWVNYLLSTEVQNRIPVLIGYNPVNTQAKVPSNLQVYFPNLKSVFIPDWRYVQTQLNAWTDRWNREVER